MTPKRLQRKRVKGWRKPEGAVCVTRPSRWANPYREADGYSRAEAVALFEAYALKRLEAEPGWLEPLRGKDLACTCPPGELCHADVLLRLANG